MHVPNFEIKIEALYAYSVNKCKSCPILIFFRPLVRDKLAKSLDGQQIVILHLHLRLGFEIKYIILSKTTKAQDAE